MTKLLLHIIHAVKAEEVSCFFSHYIQRKIWGNRCFERHFVYLRRKMKAVWVKCFIL